MISELAPDLSTHWLTGTSATCTGLFKPVYLGGTALPDLGPEPTGVQDADSIWWAHERLHRAVIRDFPGRLPLYRQERDDLEASFLAEAADVYHQHRGLPVEERAQALDAFTASCFARAASATVRWTERVSSMPVRQRPPWLFARAWDIVDRQAGL
jgi:dipeptidase